MHLLNPTAKIIIKKYNTHSYFFKKKFITCICRSCYQGSVTLGGYGVLGAGGCVGLGAVAAGVLQGVSAALLLLHTEASGQNHSQSTSCWREWLAMLKHSHA